jgi:adenylate cyclase
MPKLTFAKECTVSQADDSRTLLEWSLAQGIPHMCACGGNAKCSTCRVMVMEGIEHLSEPTSAEWKLSAKKGFDANIRLACQARPTGDVVVRRLVLDELDADVAIAEEAVHSVAAAGTGREAQIAVLFTDIREFTPFVDSQLPYDVIHLLDRFFRLAGEAVLGHGGFIDKYMGDGMMAIFGLSQSDAAATCEAAIGAGLEIVRRVEELDQYTMRNFGVNLRVGVGIHHGPALVGTYGHPSRLQFSAIGDTVNVAARIESATRALSGTGMLVSDAVFEQAQESVHVARVVKCPLKGKAGDHVMYQIDRMLERPIDKLAGASRQLAVIRALRRVVTRRTAPIFLRLSYHDAITWDPSSRVGGADGSIRFAEELARPESRGLQPAVETLLEVQRQLPGVSFADLVAQAGAVAVLRAGGPDIGVRLGRKDSEIPSRNGLMPSRDWGAVESMKYFADRGFDARLWTALSGAHTLGRVGNKTFTEDPYEFNNSYFATLLMGGEGIAHLLATDRALLEDDACCHWVKVYACDKEKFFADFGEAYTKLVELGR